MARHRDPGQVERGKDPKDIFRQPVEFRNVKDVRYVLFYFQIFDTKPLSHIQRSLDKNVSLQFLHK